MQNYELYIRCQMQPQPIKLHKGKPFRRRRVKFSDVPPMYRCTLKQKLLNKLREFKQGISF